MRLRLVGSSLSQIARELSVAPTTVTSVSQGHRRSRRIESAIAAKLNILPQALWRDRYPTSDSLDTVSIPLIYAQSGGEPLSAKYCRP